MSPRRTKSQKPLCLTPCPNHCRRIYKSVIKSSPPPASPLQLPCLHLLITQLPGREQVPGAVNLIGELHLELRAGHLFPLKWHLPHAWPQPPSLVGRDIGGAQGQSHRPGLEKAEAGAPRASEIPTGGWGLLLIIKGTKLLFGGSCLEPLPSVCWPFSASIFAALELGLSE